MFGTFTKEKGGGGEMKKKKTFACYPNCNIKITRLISIRISPTTTEHL